MAGEDPDPEEDVANPRIMGLVTLIVLTTIVLVSVMFEKMKEFLMERSGKNMRPIVVALFGEMTVLGFIGLVLFVVVKSQALNEVSEQFLGEESALQELIENVHMVLFAVMVLYLGSCVSIVFVGQKLQQHWKNLERNAKGDLYAVVKLSESIDSKEKTKEAMETVSYMSRRRRFITKPQKQIRIAEHLLDSISEHFEFHEYLSCAFSDVAVEIVEVPASAWVALEFVFVVFYGGMQAEGLLQFGIFVAFGYCLALTMFILLRKLKYILTQVTSNTWVKLAVRHGRESRKRRTAFKSRTFTLRGSIRSLFADGDLAKPLQDPDSTGQVSDGGTFSWNGMNLPDLEDPSFLDIPLTDLTKQTCHKKVLGRTPSQQESLFWFGHMGPEFVQFLLRLLLLVNSIYIAILVVLSMEWDAFGCNDDKVLCSVIIIAGIPPPIIVMLLLPTVLATFVNVAFVETMQNHELTEKTIRIMKTRKALAALKLLMKMSKASGEQVKKEARHEDIPEPIRTERVVLDDHIEQLVDMLAEGSHLEWCASKREAGWTYGEKRDNDKKIHPDLVPFDELGDGGKDYNRQHSRDLLKVIIALGYTITKAVDTVALSPSKRNAKDLHHQRRGSLLQIQGSAVKQMEHTDNTKSAQQQELSRLSNMLAANSHQTWAQHQIKDGWVWGPESDFGLKVNSMLCPFEELDEKTKHSNCHSAMSTLDTILQINYTFERKAAGMGNMDEVKESDEGLEEEIKSRQDIEQAFAVFDPQRLGYLHNSDIMSVLHTLGWAFSETDAVKIIIEMDYNHSGTVGYKDFAKWVISHERDSNVSLDELIDNVFRTIDKDDSGSIEAAEILRALNELGEQIEYEDAQEIVREADHNGDGSIDKSEFHDFMTRLVNG